MTETMIDLPGVIAKSDDTGFLRELVQDAAQRLMDIEVAAVCGAGHGERSPERENQRNGYRPRQWDTRAGTIGLNIPKLRKGSYFPTFLEPRRTAEKALMAVIVNAVLIFPKSAEVKFPTTAVTPLRFNSVATLAQSGSARSRGGRPTRWNRAASSAASSSRPGGSGHRSSPASRARKR